MTEYNAPAHIVEYGMNDSKLYERAAALHRMIANRYHNPKSAALDALTWCNSAYSLARQNGDMDAMSALDIASAATVLLTYQMDLV